MSIVEQLGLDFGELANLLNAFTNLASPSNEDFATKIGLAHARQETLGQASQSAHTALTRLTAAQQAVETASSPSLADCGTAAGQFCSTLTASNQTWADAAQSARGQVTAWGDKNRNRGQAYAGWAGERQTAFDGQSRAVGAARDELRNLGVAAAEECDQEGRALRTLVNALRTDAKTSQMQVRKLGEHLDRLGKQDIPPIFASMARWAVEDVHAFLVQSLDQSMARADQVQAGFSSRIDQLARTASQTLAGEFRQTGLAVVEARRQLLEQNNRTRVVVDSLARAQQSIATTFEPAIVKAQSCAGRFSELESNLAIVRQHM